MADDICLNDKLFTLLLHSRPDVLQDSDLFNRLLLFIHREILEAVRKERRATTERLLRSSRS